MYTSFCGIFSGQGKLGAAVGNTDIDRVYIGNGANPERF